MSDPKIIYKAFAEDRTKGRKKLKDAEVIFIMSIFEEGIISCLNKNTTELNCKTSDFPKIKNLGVPDYDISLKRKNETEPVLWVGTFKTTNKRFMLFAEAR